jgi:hypothetical protein
MDGIGTNSGYSIYNLINILQLLIFWKYTYRSAL